MNTLSALLHVTYFQHGQKQKDAFLDHTWTDDKLWMYSFNQNQSGEMLNTMIGVMVTSVFD
jgi:hypothetical protein